MPWGRVPTKDAIRSYVLALFVELGEFVQELDWKPWKNGKKIDKERVADEFADILAFLGVILVHLEALGIDEADLAKAYRMKSVTNLRRFLGELGEEYDQTLDINTMSFEELKGDAYIKTFGVPPDKIGPLPQPPLPGMEDVA